MSVPCTYTVAFKMLENKVDNWPKHLNHVIHLKFFHGDKLRIFLQL